MFKIILRQQNNSRQQLPCCALGGTGTSARLLGVKSCGVGEGSFLTCGLVSLVLRLKSPPNKPGRNSLLSYLKYVC